MTIRENYIAVGVDGSEQALTATLWAADQAFRRGASIKLIHAYTDPVSLYAGVMAAPQINFEEAHDWAEAVLTAAESGIHQRYPRMVISRQIRHAHPVTALLEVAEHALFTVVGASGINRLEGFLLGSVAARVAGHAPGPVVVIPGKTEIEIAECNGAVVVGLDSSAESDAALAFAFEEASLRSVSLVAVRAWEDAIFERFAKIFPIPVDRAAIVAEETRLLAEQLAGWVEKYPDVQVRRIVHGGDPASRLIQECVDLESTGAASLLVVGSRGRSTVTGLLFGSTSQALMTRAICPVAVVRADH